jgi:glycosyltransferase involved in cell wall biosynthesis
VIVTPNAINEVTWKCPVILDEIQSLRSSLNINESDFVIGFVGSLRTWHGVDMLLNCIPRLADEIQDAKFLIVGSGELEKQLLALSSSSKWGDRVIVTGGVSHHDVPRHMSLMSVGLMPHSNEWGSPMKILEYMAMSVTVVAPRLAPIEEIVQHHRTGILFDPRDEQSFCNAIEMLAKDRAFAKQLSKKAREFVFSERTWKDNAQRVIESSHLPVSVK